MIRKISTITEKWGPSPWLQTFGWTIVSSSIRDATLAPADKLAPPVYNWYAPDSSHSEPRGRNIRSGTYHWNGGMLEEGRKYQVEFSLHLRSLEVALYPICGTLKSWSRFWTWNRIKVQFQFVFYAKCTYLGWKIENATALKKVKLLDNI